LGALTVGYTYLYADQGGGERSNLNGWFVRPSFNVLPKLSVFADFTNYYGSSRKGSLNSHGYTFGVSHAFAKWKGLQPAVFGETGDIRVSNDGKITNTFAILTGVNVQVPLNRHVSIAITPAEYVLLFPSGGPRNDFNAKFGFSFPFGQR
jgi:hypothetical protein